MCRYWAGERDTYSQPIKSLLCVAADLRSQRGTSPTGVFRGEWWARQTRWPHTFLMSSSVAWGWQTGHTENYLCGMHPMPPFIIWLLRWRKERRGKRPLPYFESHYTQQSPGNGGTTILSPLTGTFFLCGLSVSPAQVRARQHQRRLQGHSSSPASSRVFVALLGLWQNKHPTFLQELMIF